MAPHTNAVGGGGGGGGGEADEVSEAAAASPELRHRHAAGKGEGEGLGGNGVDGGQAQASVERVFADKAVPSWREQLTLRALVVSALLAVERMGFLRQPFTRQENTVIQTCVVSAYGITSDKCLTQ